MERDEFYEFLKLVSNKWLLETSLTEDEKDKIEELVAAGIIGDELAEEIRASRYDPALLNLMEEVDADKEVELKKLWSRIHGKQGVFTMSSRYKTLLISLTAAASVLLVVGLVLFHGKDKIFELKQAPRETAQQDMPPAMKGATLKLADGSLVPLDSAGTGKIASQGDNEVKKNAGGILAYDHHLNAGVNTLYNTLTTARGQRFRLDLPDGSIAWLNAGSSLTYFAQVGQKDTARLVTLSGEAYFEIAPDRSKPFVVNAGGTSTTVLGTHFNVTAYSDEPAVVITLLQGAVRVGKESRYAVLKPGQQVTSPAGATGFQVNEHTDTARVISWKEGYFEFYAPLDQVMRELSRWYNVDLDLKGNPHDLVVMRESREVPLSHVLRKLEEAGAGHFKIVDKKITMDR